MKFKYTAKIKSGELQAGFVEAVNKEAASNILTSHELFVLSLEAEEKSHWYDRFLKIFKSVKLTDLMIFTRQFATLLESQIPLGDALKNLYRQTRSPLLKEAVFDIFSDVDAGLSLSQALERHSGIFSDFYVSMVRSGEITGKMDDVMIFLADYLEKETALMSRLKKALIYPVLVIVLAIIVVVVMTGVVLPQIEPIFKETNAEIPYITKLLFVIGNFISNWQALILIVIAFAFFILYDYFRTAEGKAVRDEILIKSPLGGLFKKLYVARFTESASVLIKGGIPIAQALEIAGHTIGSIVYQDIIHDIAEGVREGKLLSQSLEEKEFYFPSLVSQMVAIGESTGRLDELLSKISSFYTREVDDSLNNLVELIQPLLIVFIGVGVGALFAAVLLPIYNMISFI